jgi:hypothetical protein
MVDTAETVESKRNFDVLFIKRLMYLKGSLDDDAPLLSLSKPTTASLRPMDMWSR